MASPVGVASNESSKHSRTAFHGGGSFFGASSALQPWRRLLSLVGPGFLIAVGYMDPGNWATDLAAGSRYGYALLLVAMMVPVSADYSKRDLEKPDSAI